MQQMVITYVLSGLANIADVNPRDVHTSLFSGNVRVNNVSLRPETMNKLLPLPIEEGTVPEMEMQIPNPSTAAPMEVRVRRGRVLLQLDLSSPPLDRTPECIMRGITDQSILGSAAAASLDDDASEPVSPVTEGGGPAGYDYSSAGSDVDEEDFASCASDGDTSDTESTSSGSHAGSPTAAEEAQAAAQAAGWFGYLRTRAAQSVEWIWRRQLRITFTDLTLVLPCDVRKNIHFEIGVGSFVVTVEPTQTSGAEQMKIVSMEIGGGVVVANASDARARVIVVESLSIKITTVYETNTERVLRKNVVLAFNGTNTLTADEATLFALLKCHLSRQMRLSVPTYCLRFSGLRARGSLWPYATACVVEGLRDCKQRYNFNASHLRFYAHARERYVQLLHECHRSQSIEERRQELADAEQDLRYEDVILYLRRLVQARYAPSVGETDAATASSAAAGDAAAELEPLVVSSTHVEWRVVKVILPARNTIFARNTTLIFRNEETVFTVAAVSLDTDGAVLTMAAPALNGAAPAELRHTAVDEETSLIYVHMREDTVSSETKVSLQPVALSGSMDGALRCLTPIAEALQRIGEQEKSGATTRVVHTGPGTGAPPAGAVKQSTTIVAVHRVAVQLDDFYFLLDRLSATTAKAPGTPDKVGCTVRQCSLRHKTANILSPLDVRMTPRGGVVVSRIALEVPRETWAVWRRDADSLRLLIHKLPRLGSAGVEHAAVAAPAQAGIDLAALQAMARVLQWSPVSGCPAFEVEEITATFHPLDCTAAVHRIAVQTVAPASRGPYGTHITVRSATVECRHTGRATLRVVVADGVRIGSSVAPSVASAVSVPSLHVSARRAEEEAVVPLLSLDKVTIASHDAAQSISVAAVSLAGSVQLADVGCVYKTDTSVVPASDRPCLTSSLQVALAVRSADVPQLCAAPLPTIAHVLGEVYAFAEAELIPEEFYRIFFSSFSDMALQLRMRECVVRCGAGEALLLSVANTASPERVAALAMRQPCLPVAPDDFPVLVLNDMQQLSMSVDVSQLVVTVSAPPPPATAAPSSVAVTVRGVLWRMPLEKMPFWCAEVQEIAPVPQRLSLEAARVVARIDRAAAAAAAAAVVSLPPVLEVSLASLEVETVSSSSAGAAGAGGSLGLSVSKDLPLTPSESDRGSCASSTEEQYETSQVSLHRWGVDVDLTASVADLGGLQHVLRAMAAARECLTRRVVLRGSVAAAEYHMDDCGDIFLDAPTQMVVVEDCVFRAGSADRHVVVCSGTSAVFRRCVFAHPAGLDLLRAASRSALFVCEDCRAEGDAAAPGVPSPRGSSPAPDTGVLRPLRRVQVSVDEGSVAIQLDAASRLVCTQRTLAFSSKRKRRRSLFKMRNGELRVDYADAEQRVPVLTKTSVEGELSLQLPHRSCSASCSVSCGEVTIPIVPRKLRAVRERLGVLTSVAPPPSAAAAAADSTSELPPADYVVPPPPSKSTPQLRLPYDSWKLLLSLSLIPVTVRLPGGMAVARVTFSNAFVWSKRELLAEAQLEARVAVHDVALWECRQQSFAAVVGSPIFIGVQGRMPHSLSATVTASVSPVEAVVSTDQLKLLLHALSSEAAAAAAEADAEVDAGARAAPPEPHAAASPKRGLRWYNFTGVTLQARGGGGGGVGVGSTLVRVPSTLCSAASSTAPTHDAANAVPPFSVVEVDGAAVDHVERDLSSSETGAFNGQPAPLFVSRRTIVLEDKRRFHVTSTLERDLLQTIAVRTLVQLRNETPLPLVLTAGGEAAHVIAPLTLSCVPEAMLHRTDVSVAVQLSPANGTTTLREPLLPESTPAADFYRRTYQQGFPAADMAREFTSQLDGSPTFMVTAFEVQGPVLLMRFRPARPHVVNDTVYPLRIAAVNARGELLAREDIPAGERAYFLSLPPSAVVHGRLQLFVDEDVYEARGDVALFDRAAARVDGGVVVAHQAHPRRHLLELGLSADSSGPAGEYGVAVTAGHQCLVKNCTSTDVFFATDDGDSVGTMGTRGLPAYAEGGAVGYVPSNTPLRLKPRDAAPSETFEMDSSGAGCVVQCDHVPEASAVSASYYLLHASSAGPTHRLAEILPAVVFRNRHAHRTLCVKHVRRQAGAVAALEERVLEVPPLSDRSYCTLSKYGYTNDLLFAWCAGATTHDATTFSSVVETDLAPGTTWSGFVCVGTTHHQVDIAKASLYETACVTVGPAVLPRVKLVNLSTTAFRDVGCCQVAYPQPSKNNKYLLLTSAGGAVYTVDLLQEDPLELEAGVVAQTIRGDGDRCCVVLSSKRVFATTDKTWAEEVQLSVNVQTGAVSLRLRDASAVPLHVLWRSLAANVMWWTQTTSVQCSVTGVCLESSYEGRKQHVVEPFDADVSLREMHRTSHDVYLKGFYIGLQPLVITVSDVLLYQLQMAGSRCQVEAPPDPLAWVQESAAVALRRRLPTALPQLLHIGNAGIAETPLELSWDRSTRPPQDFLLGDSAISKLIPSLHHAMLVLPKLQLRNVSRVSPAELIGRVQQILIMEVVKQIPKMVTTVGLFKKNSSLLEKVTSTVTSLLFRPSTTTDTTDDGSSAHI
ncbi:N-terminal region of Chorein, a TM vesicle-mediated sorter [Novymonas esmeraldas]|uniref:N-terminal region of Chorein, a TM vesicle-mediated sorter n=1 Tax=Novymonas esmeraldas TaxID=1808958 RepID=A0AAW0EU46_9TRYP